jgi:dTMP kinase
MNLETEALLMFAARREHLAQVIEPALIRGDWVVCDRFTDASFAYQGAGRGLSFERLTQLEHWVQRGLTPHLTFLFDLPVAIAAERLVTAREPDKFEAESTTFFNRVREGYLKRVDAEPHRFIVIDASQPLDTVTKCVADILERDKRLWP